MLLSVEALSPLPASSPRSPVFETGSVVAGVLELAPQCLSRLFVDRAQGHGRPRPGAARLAAAGSLAGRDHPALPGHSAHAGLSCPVGSVPVLDKDERETVVTEVERDALGGGPPAESSRDVSREDRGELV